MAFGAVTILMDTLNQHFLLPTPRFPLRNKRKVKYLYKNLSSLQTCLEEELKVGKYDEAIMKGLEGEVRDVSVELRFQIEEQLTLFYLGKAMKLRLESSQKLIPILNRAIKDMDTLDFDNFVLDILPKHLALPVTRIPAHIKKRVKSFCTRHHFLFYALEFKNEQEVGDEQEGEYEQESNDEQESEDEQEVGDEEESEDEEESKEEQKSDDKQGSKDEQEVGDEQESEEEQKSDDKQGSKDEQEVGDEQEREDEWESEEEQKSDDERKTEYELETSNEHNRNMLYEASSLVRQELRASNYLKTYMRQRLQARHRIRQLFCLGIKLTSYFNKQLLKVKNANHQPENSQNNITGTASIRGPERVNITVGDTSESTIKMVGCDDEFNTIMDNLNQQSKKQQIVSIVGMGGIGKTTLARRIYGDESFISHFDCRAWVTISHEYNPRQVFQALLHSLAPEVFKNNETSKDKLAMQVYQCLKGRRYVIVIDDLWSTDVWDNLMRCFQDDSNGSRVLLTTRLQNVADYASSGSHFCHTKRFLDSNESWNLFRKVCKRITLSPEFEKIAREIVEKCKGLPLAITVAAGILSNSNQTFNEWERIAKNVATLSLDHSNEQRENIIDLSYTFLPHHLKLCFLSFGCFPEDYKVAEDMIVNFWVSEGFLKVLRSKSLEDVARGNLQDLVDRNLLICGCGEENDKLYQMHDVLRELALREAQKENQEFAVTTPLHLLIF